MIMSKWETVFSNKGTVNNGAVSQVTNTKLNTVKSKSVPELKKESEKLFAAKIAKENSLVDAYEEKKLKSKALIKEGKRIKAKRDKKTGGNVPAEAAS